MNEIRKHTITFLNKGIRYDGRKPEEIREITLETGISKNAEGSARARIGETDVMVGIKMAVEKPFPDTPEEGMLMVGAELLPMSNPEFEAGPPSEWAVEIARVVDRGIRESKAVDLKKLCIEKGEKAWCINIDICTINDAGNILDAAALATVAALKNTVMPKYEDGIINYKELTKKKLPIQKTPISITVYKIGEHLIIDPIKDEEKASDARLTATWSDNNICALQKGGDTPITTEDIEKMIDLSEKKAKEIAKHIKE